MGAGESEMGGVFVVSREESIQQCLALKLEIETLLSGRPVTPEEAEILRVAELKRVEGYQEKYPVAYRDIHIQTRPLRLPYVMTPEDVRKFQENAARSAIEAEYRKQRMAEEQALIRAWAEANPELYREIIERGQAEMRQHAREVNKVWRDKHKDECRWYRQDRRARIRELPSTLTLKEWQEILSFYHYQCVYCGVMSHDLTQDHLVPVVLQGGYTKDNIVPACHSCNSRKGTGYCPFVCAPMPQHVEALIIIKATCLIGYN